MKRCYLTLLDACIYLGSPSRQTLSSMMHGDRRDAELMREFATLSNWWSPSARRAALAFAADLLAADSVKPAGA